MIPVSRAADNIINIVNLTKTLWGQADMTGMFKGHIHMNISVWF